MNIDEAKSRLRKLLSVTEQNGATLGEVMNAARAAQRLMHEYNLSEADAIRDAEEHRDAEIVREAGVFKRITVWERNIAVYASLVVGGVAVYAGLRAIDFVGHAERARFASDVFRSMRASCMRLAPREGVWSGSGRSYAIGFAHGLMDAWRQEQRDVCGTALALRLTTLVRQAEQHYELTRPVKPSTKPKPPRVERSSYEQGHEDGRRSHRKALSA